MSWRSIEGYEGIYDVSDDGRVYSIRSKREMSQNLRRGYPSVYFRDLNGVGTQHVVHGLVSRAFLGPRPDGYQVNHKDGNKSNNHVSNLEYVTHSENMKHAFRNGLQSNVGENHSRHRLTEEDIKRAFSLIAAGVKQVEIGRLLGVSQSHIAHIKRRKVWPHLQLEGV